MNRIILKKILLVVILATSFVCMEANNGLLKYVDTSIGTGQRPGSRFGQSMSGKCMPAVFIPGGTNFWTPQTQSRTGHNRPPYFYDSPTISGLRCSHWMDGSATQDYGSVTVMPLPAGGKLICDSEERASKLDHSTEVCQPDYYAISLFDKAIRAEMTGTSHTGIMKFTFRDAGRAHLVITPNHELGMATLKYDEKTGEVTGSNPVHRIYQGNGQPAGFYCHFVVQTDKTPVDYGTYDKEGIHSKATNCEGPKGTSVYLGFDVKAGETITLKMATSYCDVAGASNNLRVENPGWNFKKIQNLLVKAWKKRLGVITVKGQNEDEKKAFYTAIYHSSFLPHAFNDVDGRYPSFGGGERIMHTDGIYYSEYSLWDTFRTLHPLFNLLYPTSSGDMITSLLNKYEQGGWMPIFPAWNCYTSEMIGDHVASLVCDAYVKGVRNFDLNKAYEALRKNAYESPDSYEDYKDGKGRRAIKSYLKYGYIPVEDNVNEAFHRKEQTSRTLEYAYDDYCVGIIAKALGHDADARDLFRRSEFYKNVFNPTTGYVDGRHEDGSFVGGPTTTSQYYITEGNACQYSWFVPHDIYGMMACMGGKESYVLKLDSMFTENRMWHGNEPSHHIDFMYNYAGMPWKTSEVVRSVLDTEYGVTPDGFSGNDDTGQMSAWLVFAYLGFYPVCPGTDIYTICGPVFPEATIRLENGHRFIVKAPNVSRKNIYIQSARLNGKVYEKNYILHSDIVAGGTLEFEMGSTPNKQWGSAPSACPPSRIGM